MGTFGGGVFYFCFAFVPMFIAYSATMIDTSLVELFQSTDSRVVQQILPSLVLKATPIWCQVLFFGALLSAILSTASGTLLAPASVLTENVLRVFLTRLKLTDKAMLLTLRSLLILVAIVATTMSVNSNDTMYEMVEAGYSVTLVVAFVPLVFGIYWKRATTQGAVFSIVLAVSVWLGFMFKFHDEESTNVWLSMPPQLYGLAAAIVGMLIGSTMPNWIQHREADHSEIASRRSTATGH
jgi:Na+/proline symporter